MTVHQAYVWEGAAGGWQQPFDGVMQTEQHVHTIGAHVSGACRDVEVAPTSCDMHRVVGQGSSGAVHFFRRHEAYERELEMCSVRRSPLGLDRQHRRSVFCPQQLLGSTHSASRHGVQTTL